ncbi:MAG TPA: hypothetical protein VFP10_02220, partial [Candidatus Eisenbacteria bacterium]|nr:hypothetical protein [Candidatus Eisenbacteria bacterium]
MLFSRAMTARKVKRTGTPAAAPARPSPTAALPPSWLHYLALVAVFLVAALLSLRDVGSPDMGFHLKTGDYILAGHGIPRTDPFTDTMKGHRYTDTSWGYDVIVATVFRGGGAAALVLFHTALVLFTFFMLYRTCRLLGADPTSLVLFLLAGVVASETRFEVRPEIVSYALLALLLHLLHRYAEGKPVRLWSIPALMLAWSNVHSLYVLGWLAMAAFLAG